MKAIRLVDALGPQVHRPVPGQRVAVINEKGGNWADYAVVPALFLLPVPDDLPDEQVRRIVGQEGVKYAIDPVVGETGNRHADA